MASDAENKQNAILIERLGNLHVLILDTSLRAAQLTRTVLSSLGITQNTLARDTEEAAFMLTDRLFDLLILDWECTPKDGIELTRHIRRTPDLLNRTIPVIMTSQRSALEDIAYARDAGVNEYLVKPFSARSLLTRLYSIVDEPRSFIIVRNFIGPDRRRKGSPPPGVSERRDRITNAPQVISRDAINGLEADDRPKIIMPDFSLKQKIEALPSKMAGLDALLPQAEAQKLSKDFVQWMIADVAVIRQSYRLMQSSPEYSITYAERIRGSCATIRSRAMSCGYVLAAKVAAQLHDFCQKFYQKDNPQHLIVIEKHIDTLSAVLNNRLGGEGGPVGSELFNELVQLVNKAIRIV